MKYRVSTYYLKMLFNSLRNLRTSNNKDSKSVNNLRKQRTIACIDLAMNNVFKGRITKVSKIFLYINVYVLFLVLIITAVTAFSSVKEIIFFEWSQFRYMWQCDNSFPRDLDYLYRRGLKINVFFKRKYFVVPCVSRFTKFYLFLFPYFKGINSSCWLLFHYLLTYLLHGAQSFLSS